MTRNGTGQGGFGSMAVLTSGKILGIWRSGQVSPFKNAVFLRSGQVSFSKSSGFREADKFRGGVSNAECGFRSEEALCAQW